MVKKSVGNNNFLNLAAIAVVGMVIVIWGLNLTKSRVSRVDESQKTNTADVVALVDKAAKVVTEKGETALADFKDVNGEFMKGEMYIFAYDMNSKTLVLPPTPEVEGTSRYNTKDSNGKYYVREMATYLKTHDSGWIDYNYPKPNETTPSLKLSYFKKAMLNGKPIFVGSGIYLK